MPNQMIALQARNPQLPDPARATTQMANMMNMASQQRAAQLQGERARQEMEYARAGETRAAETQRLNVRKEDQAFRIAGMTELRNRGVGVLKSGSEAAYQLWLKQADAIDPDSAAVMREIAPTFNKDALTFAIMKADEYLDKAIPNAEASVEIAAEGGVDAQGRRVPPGTPVQVTTGLEANTRAIPMAGAATPPRATPTAPPASAMERGPSAVSGAPMTFGTDAERPLNATQQEDLRRIQSETGMTDTPASFTRGGMGGAGAVQMTPEVAQQIVDTAVKTGMMAQADFDQLMALAPEQNKQPFMDMLKANNIALQPGGAGQQPQFADLRGQRMQSQTAGLRGAPPMEQTLAQYQPLQRRDPNVSPLPGSSQVPLSRVAAEAQVQRETPAEAAAKAAATARATAVVETEKKAAEKAPGRKQVSTIIKKIRGAYEELEKKEAIASEKRGGFANVMDYLATTSPGREVQKALGTSSSKYLSEIVNSRKLLATAIKNATGMSAQEMNSNVELQLTLDALTDPTQGIEAARSTLDTLEELYGAPRTASAQGARSTPTLPVLTPEQVRANPNVKRWKTTDGRVMTRP